uniref:Uncharacterized protein n=1 Tax=Erythrolobus madagascarensis TaxID=708628 RepID=A0A7S0T5Q3_9RHOD
MTSTGTGALTEREKNVCVVENAIGVRSPKTSDLASTLQKMEKTRRSLKKQHGADSESDMLLLAPCGKYELVYATGKEVVKRDRSDSSNVKRIARGFYWPSWLVNAGISFAPDESTNDSKNIKGAVENSARCGALELRFRGRYEWIPAARKLSFNFYEMIIRLGSMTLMKRELVDLRTVTSQAEYFDRSEQIRTLPFFIFFESNDSFAAARGRGGGLALWKRTK